MKTTAELLFEHYHTTTRRPMPSDALVRTMAFRTLERTVGPWLPGNRESRILDVGCGEGMLLLFLRERGYRSLAGFDLSPENVAICHSLGLDFVARHDALQTDWPNDAGSFEVIFAMDILEHIPKPSAAGFLNRLRTKLASGGSLIVQTPNLGSVMGSFHRYYDLSHEFGVTERSAVDLFLLAGFSLENIEIVPAWNAGTLLGHCREAYLRLVHNLVFLSEGSSRPRIPTKNLLIRACNSNA